MSERTLPFTVNLDGSTVNWVKQQRYALIVQNNCTADDKGDPLYTVHRCLSLVCYLENIRDNYVVDENILPNSVCLARK